MTMIYKLSHELATFTLTTYTLKGQKCNKILDEFVQTLSHFNKACIFFMIFNKLKMFKKKVHALKLDITKSMFLL